MRQQEGVVVHMVEHAWQGVGQLVALRDEDEAKELLSLTGDGEVDRLVAVEPGQIELAGRLQARGVERAVRTREHADAARQVAVQLHVANAHEAVEPGVGFLLQERLVADLLDALEEVVALLALVR